MILWTIQEEAVYKEIMETGVYRCDFAQSSMPEWKEEYDWLVKEMKKRIGNPPNGIMYPVWAWYQWEGKRKKPDLRRERWECGFKGDIYTCMEIDIPEDKALLSDFDAWSIILLHGMISDTEEENKALEERYNSMAPSGQKKMRDKNWERVFDLTPIHNDWMTRGDSIQATFWELRREEIKKVQFFTAMSRYPSRPNDPRVKNNR